MCGINGIILNKKNAKEDIKSSLEQMNNAIIHRGPDEDGFYIASDGDATVGMAMRRLSIIDLTSGKQPMYANNKSIGIVFNGEIYNYRSLKSDLTTKSITFNTTSDTEVILKLYEEYGTDSFKLLDGMYGFSIHDKTKNKLYIARDFFGEKPLYYTNSDNGLIWASELKSMIPLLNTKPEISKKGLNLFFRLTYIPAPFTIYENVYKLESNSYIEYDLIEHTFKIQQINNGDIPEKKIEVSFEDAKQKVKELVYESVSGRSISDVPLGTFLSGGVDSSIVSLCLAQHKSTKINTFSIGFKKASYDETDKSRTVANLINSNHHEFVIDENDLKNDIHEILLNFDEPFADSSALPTYLVSKKTREHVKVALTGDGGDEVFGGYNKYYMGKINNRYTAFMPQGLHNIAGKVISPLLRTSDDNRGKRYRMKKIMNSIDYSGEYYWDIIALGTSVGEAQKIINNNWYDNSIFNYYKEKMELDKPKTLTDFRYVDKYISLEGDMLVKVDRTSMLNSLECRAPFLNKKIWNYTNSLPENYLMKGWNKKYILKEAFRDQFPSNFLEKSKSGFGVPVGDWLKSGLRKELESYIEYNLLEKQNIFNIENIVKVVKNHLSGKEDNTFSVWSFYCFQKWYVHHL